MSKRFINCTACRGCHTGRGGRYCPFVSPGGTKHEVSSSPTMASADVPDRDSPQYVAYLAEQIEEEEERLKMLKDKCRVATMEEQLARLRLQTTEMTRKSVSLSDRDTDTDTADDTGVASQLLAAVNRGSSGGGSSHRASTPAAVFSPQRPKEEKEVLSKLQAISHLAEPKAIEMITYRDFIYAMTRVLKTLTELEIDPRHYAAHMSFIASKAALNLYATDALIKYEAGVTERVISGQYTDWVVADPECVALHLGADATYAVRQGGGSRWGRAPSASYSQGRDFSDWPKEVCWLFNNTSCYFPRCKKAHICVKCKKTGHTMKDCKVSDDSASVTSTEALSSKGQKEGKKA